MAKITLAEVFASPDLLGLYGIEPVKQTLPNACGACCLATALRFYGTPVTEQNAVDTLGTNPAIGSSPIAMLKCIAEKRFNGYAFTGFPLRLALESAASQRIVLIRWDDRPDHWQILVGIEPKLGQLVLLSPASPYFTLVSMNAFGAQWTASPQFAMTIARPARESAIRSKAKTDFRVRPYRAFENGRRVEVRV